MLNGFVLLVAGAQAGWLPVQITSPSEGHGVNTGALAVAFDTTDTDQYFAQEMLKGDLGFIQLGLFAFLDGSNTATGPISLSEDISYTSGTPADVYLPSMITWDAAAKVYVTGGNDQASADRQTIVTNADRDLSAHAKAFIESSSFDDGHADLVWSPVDNRLVLSWTRHTGAGDDDTFSKERAPSGAVWTSRPLRTIASGNGIQDHSVQLFLEDTPGSRWLAFHDSTGGDFIKLQKADYDPTGDSWGSATNVTLLKDNSNQLLDFPAISGYTTTGIGSFVYVAAEDKAGGESANHEIWFWECDSTASACNTLSSVPKLFKSTRPLSELCP